MKVLITITACILVNTSTFYGATPTLIFDNVVPLTAAGTPINIGNHAAPRLVDWNNDGVLDLLVAGGDGYIWLFLQDQVTNSTDFLAGTFVMASGSPVRVGTGYTGACFTDINGDGLPDLVAAGNDNRVRFYANNGTPGNPAFNGYIIIQGSTGDFAVPALVSGRIDIADWDGDGLLDLFTGEFDGYLTWYRNAGTTNTPIFGAPGLRMNRDGSTLHDPYNVHPRVLDFNQDGLPDLAYGINWGHVKTLVNTHGFGTTNFSAYSYILDTNGVKLEIRSLIGNDTTPDFADLNGDGALDVISGGQNGQLFFIPGLPQALIYQRIEAIMDAHTNDLGTAFVADTALRDNLFGLHRGLRSLSLGVLALQERQAVRDWYQNHIARYPQYLSKRSLDQTNDAYVPFLAGQVWINLFECLPDSAIQRRETAATCGFVGTHSNLLVDLGMMYIENSRSTAASQQALYDIAASIPAPLQIVEVVTEKNFLNPPNGSGVGIEARRAVNVFAQVGDYTEGFPPEVPQTRIDGFSVVVAHELNHNVEQAAGQIYPWYWDRKYDLLEQASPPDVIFKDHNLNGFGIDLPATQAHFLSRGLWDGNSNTWASAYNAYWSTGPGQGFNRHWLRDNLQFCLGAPQEAFATLANQYFTSSEVMLQLALSRWAEGITNCINQFLFFANVYALNSNSTWFYRIDTAANVTRAAIPLKRDSVEHISSLSVGTNRYDFALDAEGNVSAIFVNSNTNLFDGLLAYYPFNGNANDESGNGRHGVVLGATLAGDRYGRGSNAYRFDDIDDGIRIGSMSITGQLTISAWIFKEGDSVTHDQIVCTTNAGGVYLSIFPNSNPSLKNHIDFGANYSPTDRYFSTNAIPLNAWVHVAATYDGQRVRLFVNGQLVQEAARTGGFTTGTMYIGRDGAGAASDVFRGVIDDVRIYNRALNQFEMAGLFSAELTLPRPSINQPEITPDNRFSILIAGGEVGRLYRVQGSTNLSSWSDITNFVSTINAWRFIDPMFTNYSRRFYRVVSE